MASKHRLQLLHAHLHRSQPQPAAAPAAENQDQAVAGLRNALRSDARQRQRHQVFEFFAEHSELLPEHGLSKEEHRALSLKGLLQAQGPGSELKALELMEMDPAMYYEQGCALHCVDLSLAIKSGVQFTLWGGSVLNLGSEKHHRRYRDAIADVSLPGCFAMTELGHGSNVGAIATEATYDPAAEEFVINTPCPAATKWWIGNAAEDGRAATVFAQLEASGEARGVHAFVVPLRGPDGAVLPGVTIRDCGQKVGLNGVDNGAIQFQNVRIPRDNLLDRFASVAPDGSYSSPVASASKRFALMMGALTGGRVGLAAGSNAVLQLAVTIAVRYATRRRQFGPDAADTARAKQAPATVAAEASAAGGAPEEKETPIMDYPAHQRKLLPLLAAGYAHHFAADHLVDRYAAMKTDPSDEAARAEVHALSSGLKPAITAATAAGLDVCREACGGHGYAAVNRLGELRDDHDVWKTFEGDNTVLLQQLAAELVKSFGRRAQARGAFRVAAEQLLGAKPTATAGNLRDCRFHLAALRHREGRLTQSAALRLRRLTTGPGALPQFEAWSRCMNQLLKLAAAHVDAVVLEQFMARAAAAADPQTRARLSKLCALHGAWKMLEHLGSHQAAGVVGLRPLGRHLASGAELEREFDALCSELRPDVGLLVDAFDIPDHIVRAPIGLQGADDMQAYMRAAEF